MTVKVINGKWVAMFDDKNTPDAKKWRQVIEVAAPGPNFRGSVTTVWVIGSPGYRGVEAILQFFWRMAAERGVWGGPTLIVPYDLEYPFKVFELADANPAPPSGSIELTFNRWKGMFTVVAGDTTAVTTDLPFAPRPAATDPTPAASRVSTNTGS